MYKNLILILVAAAFLWACGGQTSGSKEETTTTQQEEVVAEPMNLSLAEFKDKAETIVGQDVILEGDVIHVCKHGGKKMFITADDPDVRVKITTGDNIPAFDVELEGRHVKVFGVVEEIMPEATGEGQLLEEGEHEEDADHENYYHKPQYSLKCVKYVVEETSPEEE